MTVTYSANTSITLDLSSLASSSTFLAGIESGEIDNTTNRYDDVIVNVKGITAHASTALTAGQLIAVSVWGSQESLGTTAIDTLDGTSSTETLSHSGIFNSLQLGGAAVATATTAGQVSYIMPFSVAQLFGGNMPKFWGLYVAHNHNGALGASNNNLFSYTGVKYAA